MQHAVRAQRLSDGAALVPAGGDFAAWYAEALSPARVRAARLARRTRPPSALPEPERARGAAAAAVDEAWARLVDRDLPAAAERSWLRFFRFAARSARLRARRLGRLPGRARLLDGHLRRRAISSSTLRSCSPPTCSPSASRCAAASRCARAACSATSSCAPARRSVPRPMAHEKPCAMPPCSSLPRSGAWPRSRPRGGWSCVRTRGADLGVRQLAAALACASLLALWGGRGGRSDLSPPPTPKRQQAAALQN